ncbi:MAG: 16S rRNA (adenine(1518)-N(6)/adenine(1519)-N(6))-dimethyltransferase RsmA [Patescibacteria group bacterium]|nr:16S rRNA (adenine(1518)-N(6)/adenine(1519)-N(6))-dimethyltransferase RsmA [Patescibacteria group bacterium]
MFKQKKFLGQNFLINDKIIPDIIKVAEIKKDDVVIEIGPGLGILTKALIDAGAKVYAIEKDFELAEMLRKALGKNKNLTIVHQDALFFDLSIFKKYKVVSNLPFNIASPLIRKFLESQNQPELMVVMVQKEVAEKIVAKPGDSERGILTLAVEFYANAEIIMTVSKNSFRPQPQVDAAILKLQPYPHTRYADKVGSKLFFQIVKAGFSAKRRQIRNSLAATLRLEKDKVTDILKKAQIDPSLRAEDLTLKQWFVLCNVLKNYQF